MRKGYDSAVTSREEDHLNRWPLAKEIYGIAITSPREWSVRIGIYGEWGGGKTTILNFISEMARHDNNVVVHFNPWEYTSRETLWKAFVLKVYEELKIQLGDVPGIKKAQAIKWGKRLGSDIGKLLSAAASTVNDKAGEAVDVGLDLVKNYLVFGKDDLSELNDILGGRKLLVLIDDLDRTNPGLVPEILFVLKEIMDIPGYEQELGSGLVGLLPK